MRPTGDLSARGRWLVRLLLVLLLAAAGCAPRPSLESSSAAEASAAGYDFHRHTLGNGLTVITLEDFSCPIVAVQLWYHVGSKDDPADRLGFAHMFEHMMFRGSEHTEPQEHDRLIRRVGGTHNAYTSFDVTCYYEVLPANQLALALWLEAERMAFLRLDTESFETERKVVEEERRMYFNQPYGTLLEKAQAELFKVHPYRWPIIGKIAHLRAASVDDLRRFWDRYYAPNNATLVIAGAVSHQEALRLTESSMGWIPRADDPQRVAVREPMPTGRREVTLKEQNAPAPLVAVVYRTVPAGHPDEAALDLLADILGGGRSSRLYRDIIAEGQLAVGVQAMAMTLQHDGIFGVGAALQPMGGDADKLLQRIEHHVELLRSEGVRQSELVKARNRALKGLVSRNLHVSSKASSLGYAAVVEGDPARVNRQLDDIRRVTADDLQRVARVYLDPDRAMVLRVPRNLLGSLFGKKSTGGDTPDADPSEAPPPRAPTTGAPPLRTIARPQQFPTQAPIAGLLSERPEYEHSIHTLPNGMRVIVVPNHEVPMVSVWLGLLTGSWMESKVGAASMAMDMLTRGTARHSEAEMAEELDTYAISLWANGGMDSSSAGATCLADHVERAVDLLAEVVLTPTFPEDEFQKLHKQLRAGLVVSAAEPGYLAGREFRRRLHGEHPYARSASGEIADVDALAVDDLRAWWQRAVRPDVAVLIFSGDITTERALELSRKAFGPWQADGPKPEPHLPTFPEPAATHIYLVDRPGSVQSQIRVGRQGFTRRHPGYFTSLALNGYFGGAMSSRLMETVRIAKGLTYGIGGGYGASRFGGTFSIGTFSKTDSTAEAVAAILDEIRRLQNEPPSDDELSRATTYHLGSFARKHETPQSVADDLWLITSEGLPPDYIDRMFAGIAAATPEACAELARSTLDAGKMVVVVVGDAEKLKADLEKLAPVTVVQPDPIPEEPKEPAPEPAAAAAG